LELEGKKWNLAGFLCAATDGQSVDNWRYYYTLEGVELAN